MNPMHTQPNDNPPPIFRSWKQLYRFVLVLHAIIVMLFYWLKIAFS